MRLLRIFRRLIVFPIRFFQFGGFDITSDYVKPMMITGKKNIKIGKRVYIRDYARIEAINKYNKIFYSPKIIIEDDVSIEQGFHATCTKRLVIKKGTTISSYVYISDTSHGLDEVNKSVLNTELKNKEVVIGEYSFIGTGVKILPGVKVGANTVIGANSVVTHDLPDYCMAVGSPARVIKIFNCDQMKWEKMK